MPGLVGIMTLNNINESFLNKMVGAVKHQDSYRVDKIINSDFAVARIHLAIFNRDPQPIFNKDKSLCIFFDGKIYDYQKEKKKLKGYEFIFDNDAEFCLYCYEEFGIDFVKKLNGSFNFVICNVKEKKMIIVNDRHGLRPLYYMIKKGKFLFASEIKAIIKDETFENHLDDVAIAEWFAFGKLLGNKTFFEGIKVLPPASVLVYDSKNLSIRPYWNFDYCPDYNKTEEEFAGELVEKFKKAVNIRIQDHYRYGVSLSGGLDSRVIIGAIPLNKRKKILSYTFGPLDAAESKIAKQVSSKAHTKFKPIDLNPEMVIDNAESEIFYTDGLDYVGVSFIIPALKKVNNDIDVVMDGLALDMTLGGSYIDDEIVNAQKSEELLGVLYQKSRLFTDDELKKLFLRDYYAKIKNFPQKLFKKEFEKINEKNLVNYSDKFILLNHVRRYTIGGHVLLRVMLENTVPTFDNDFLDVISKIPPELRRSHKIYRQFIIKLSAELSQIPYDNTMVKPSAPLIFWKLGLAIQLGKKFLKRLISKITKGKIDLPIQKGYVNFDEWFRTNEKWEQYFKKLILNEEAISKKYLNQDYIKKLFDEQKKGEVDNSMKLLQIASFELFLKIFLEN